jgi:transcriptional regulator with XRE-family HTH domain
LGLISKALNVKELRLKSLRSREHRSVIAVLVTARKAAGLTQEQLARRLKRPQSYVSKYETGERRLDVPEFIRISRFLNADPEILIAQVLRAL